MKASRYVWPALLALSCGGKLTIDRYEPGDGAADARGGTSVAAGDAGRASMSGGAGSTSGGIAGNGDGAAGRIELGGEPSQSPQAGAAGAEPSSGGTCADVLGDCHAAECDGPDVVDQGDVPRPENPCLAGTCNAQGKPGSKPQSAHTPCDVDGGVMCDGAGHCVECVISADCPEDLYCSKEHSCGPAPCTDLDCGGACPACADGKKCLVDDDCLSFACDSVTHTCIADHCQDHHQNGGESDADCGGGICTKCAKGQDCLLNFDCASNACDGISNQCVVDQCQDHHMDGEESDIDCGMTCVPCASYKKCKSNFDCQSGWCSTGLPHLCQ